MHWLHANSVDLPVHSYGPNRNSVALSCACMGGIPDPWTQPPTPAQLTSLCAEAAAIARSWGWQEADISLQSVMTHAEGASNLDGRVMHDNYGAMMWGGTEERWDLLQLEKNGPSDGGEKLRQCISALLSGIALPAPASPLALNGEAAIQARGADLAVQIDKMDRCWAIAADLLSRYEIPYAWDASLRRILIGFLDVAPTYRDHSVQASVGWPLVELTL